MTTTINSNGSKWAGQSPDSIDTLLNVLGREPLDPTFEEYGNFIIADDPALPSRQTIRFWGNFHLTSHVFCVDTDEPELIETLTANIRANQASPAYIQARKDVFEKKRKDAEYWSNKRAKEQAEGELRARQVLGLA